MSCQVNMNAEQSFGLIINDKYKNNEELYYQVYYDICNNISSLLCTAIMPQTFVFIENIIDKIIQDNLYDYHFDYEIKKKHYSSKYSTYYFNDTVIIDDFVCFIITLRHKYINSDCEITIKIN